MGKQNKEGSYIHNLARKAIGTLGVVVPTRTKPADLVPFLWLYYGPNVKTWMRD